MGAWRAESKNHVGTLKSGDFRHNEKSVNITEDSNVRNEHVYTNGTVKVLKANTSVLAGEIIDATAMSKKALISFLE